MKTPLRWILLLILLLSLAGLACATVMGDEEPADDSPQSQATVATDSQQEPAATAATDSADTTESDSSPDSTDTDTTEDDDSSDEVSTDSNDTADAPAVLNLAKVSETLDDINSYRLQIVYEFEGTGADGSAVTQQLSGEVAYIADPAANSIHLTMDGFMPGMTGPQEVSVVQTGDQVYTLTPGVPCVAVSSDQFGADLGSSFAELANPDTFVGSLEGAELAGSETINDVEALHYTFDQSSVTQAASQFETLNGDIYIAKEGGYVVRMAMEGTGQMAGATGMQNGTIRMQFDVLDINQTIEVSPPEGCDDALNIDTDDLGGSDTGDSSDDGSGSTGDGGYPTLDDAFEVTSFQDILTYKTNTSFDEVVQFYRDQMAAGGWQSDGNDIVAAGSAILQYTHSDGRKLIITVTQDPTSGAQLVVITPTP